MQSLFCQRIKPSRGDILLEDLNRTDTPYPTDSTLVDLWAQHVRERPIPPRQRNPNVPAPYEAIVLKGLAKNPVNRYASAEELRADLRRFVAGRPISAEPVMPAPAETSVLAAADATQAVPATTVLPGGPGGQGPTRHTGRYVALLVVLLALLAGGLFLLGRELGLGSQAAAEVVPSVIHKTQDEATGILRGAGFKVKVQHVDNDADANTVVDQDPKPDARAKKGSTVTLTCLLTGQAWFFVITVMSGSLADVFAGWKSAETPALNRNTVRNATVIMFMIMAGILSKNF